MHHVAICLMEVLQDQTQRQLENLTTLIKWLQLCEVRYLTVYIENIGSVHKVEIEKYIQRVLDSEFSKKLINFSSSGADPDQG